jgi:hypothetical protein
VGRLQAYATLDQLKASIKEGMDVDLAAAIRWAGAISLPLSLSLSGWRLIDSLVVVRRPPCLRVNLPPLLVPAPLCPLPCRVVEKYKSGTLIMLQGIELHLVRGRHPGSWNHIAAAAPLQRQAQLPACRALCFAAGRGRLRLLLPHRAVLPPPQPPLPAVCLPAVV